MAKIIVVDNRFIRRFIVYIDSFLMRRYNKSMKKYLAWLFKIDIVSDFSIMVK
jgi:hypothetical protein